MNQFQGTTHRFWSAILGVLAVCSAQAAIINTGVDISPANGIDDNWQLTAISTVVSIPAPFNIPNAYVVNQPANQFPFPTWIPNDSTSSWITYSPTLYIGGDSGRTFSYEQSFPSLNETISFRWLSDNDSRVYIDNLLVGSRVGTGNYFTSWNTPVSVVLSAGQHTVRVEVDNFPRDSGNPTGMRFETVVPEPSTYVFGALVMIPVVGQILRRRANGAK